MLRILGYGMAVIGSVGIGAGVYMVATTALAHPGKVAVSSTMLTNGVLPQPEPSREIPTVEAPPASEVINIDPVVIQVPRRYVPRNRVATVKREEVVVENDHDPLHATQHHWGCEIRDSAFGGQVRVCGSVPNTR